MEQNEAVWKVKAKPAITSKFEEFQLLGYDRATEEDIWKCVQKKRKKKKEEPKFFDLVNDILQLTAIDYMNWLTAESYKKDDWMSTFKEIDSEN